MKNEVLSSHQSAVSELLGCTNDILSVFAAPQVS